MILININDLISIVPELTDLFLSGFIFMYSYSWLNNKKIDIPIFTLLSLFISILIKSFYSTIHIFILSNITIHSSIKVIVYTLTGLLLAIMCTFLKDTNLFGELLYRINNKSINDDIFDVLIDYNKRTMMYIYLKSSDEYYIGRFFYREEKGINSWISLVKYCCMDKNTGTPKFDSENSELVSSVIINLKDVERIEIFYEKDSAVWKKFERITKKHSVLKKQETNQTERDHMPD